MPETRPMFRSFHARLMAALCCGVISGAAVMPMQAHSAPADANGFTPDQRRQIVDIVRDALKTDPTILSDALVALRKGAQQQAQDDALKSVRDDRKALQSAPDYAVRGNINGDITVVEFFDPRCGYCKSVVPLMDKLLASDSKIRLVEKVIPVLSEKSVLDAQAIYAAALQGGYEKMKRALMQDTAAPSLDRIRALATANQLDAAKLVSDMHDPSVSKLINANLAEAREIGLDGTPTFIFGTASVVPGAVSYEDLQGYVAQARHAKG